MPKTKREVAHAKPERNRLIYKLHLDGHASLDIANSLCLSKQRVHAIIKAAGLKPRKQMFRDRRQKVADLVTQGYTVKEIQDILGVSQMYVLSTTSDFHLRSNRLTRAEAQKIEEIIALAINKGVSIASMTRDDRSYREKIYKYAKAHGLDLPHHTSRAARRRETIRKLKNGQ